MIKITTCALGLMLLFGFITTVSAQNYSKEIKSGDDAFDQGDYVQAAEFYSNASKTITKPSKKDMVLFYKLGFCEMHNKEYKKANISFSKYLVLAKTASPSEKELKQVNEWNQYCEAELTRMPEINPSTYENKFKITNLSKLNSELNDYGAILSSDNKIFIFTSNRMTAEVTQLIDLNDDIYMADYINGQIEEPVRIITDVFKKSDELAASLSSDNNYLYISVAIDNNSTSDIYRLSKVGEAWGNPVKLPAPINTTGWDGYPFISKDGKTLWFVSDRPGGFGGKDIYYSVLNPDDTWSTPVNAGSPVNTKFDEITPAVDSTGKTLWFSTKGQMGSGGFDIFECKLEATNNWSIPKNLEEPINSSQDDIFYLPTSKPNTVLFSSNRAGGAGIYDIYMIEYKPQHAKPAIVPSTLLAENKTPKTEPKPEAVKIVPKAEVKPVQEPVTKTESPKTEVKPAVVQNAEKPAPPKTEPVVVTKPTVPATKPETKVVSTTTKPQTPVNQPTTSTVTASSNIPVTSLPYYEPQIFNTSVTGLSYSVQLGAFKNHITVNSPYFTSKLNPSEIKEEIVPPIPLYKYTTGKFDNIGNATKYKLEMRSKGYTDAFLACYLNEQRISIEEAKELIRKQSQPN